MDDLTELLTPLLSEHDVPSLAAAVVFGSDIRAAGAVGVRKRGDPTPVTLGDKYHIGSCAKAMTAALAGVLVERGVLGWKTRLSEVFRDTEIHPGYQNVTLEQLLSHTAGLPPVTDTDEEDEDLVAILDAYDIAPKQHRLLVLPAVLAREPKAAAGTGFFYSNMGYVAAGAMLEHLTQTPFETLIVQELFTPLEITSAGFGAAGTPGQVDEPWGHSPEPVEPGPMADGPLLISPAGSIHMNVVDFAKHAAFHLTGEPPLLKRETLELLHTPVMDDYALGWSVVERDWANGVALTHQGSNLCSFATVWLAPELDVAAVAVCNLGTDAGFDAVDDAVGVALDLYTAGKPG